MSTQRSLPFRIGILSFCLLSSVALADPAEDLTRGQEAFDKENMTVAMDLFMKAAKQDYAPAQVRLGEMLYSSEYNQDAFEWFRKAANQGNSAGEYYLGHMYSTGEGVEKNYEKAVYWLRLSAEKDYNLAVRTLAQAYRNGELGLTIDLDQAKLLDDKASILDAAAKKAATKKTAAKKTATTKSAAETKQ